MFYIKINANARDWYLFTWLTVIAFLLDEGVFPFGTTICILTSKENDEIISEQEIDDMGTEPYVPLLRHRRQHIPSIPTQLKIIPHTKR